MKKVLQWILTILIISNTVQTASAQSNTCEYWITPTGNNANTGTNLLPWATLDYASSQVFKLGQSNCTVWVEDGVYNGITDLSERFSTITSFKAINPYKAILQNNDFVIKLSGVKNVSFEGFEIRHSSSASGAFLVYGSMSNGVWAENITFRNNILHDSYNEDLVKFTSGVKYITFEGNVLYNQGPNEQHMDINSVTDVTIQDNIFFNDFEGSNRQNAQDTKHFIVIKDSSGSNDGMLGAQRITVRRNIFMHFQGGNEAFVQVGNDGKPYYEAIGVRLENNLMIGDGPDSIGAVFGVAGAKDVTFVNNTVVGNLPTSAYSFRVITKDSNLQNQNITFYNNIWSDPTGTMNKFSSGTPSMITGLALDNNLYWNGSVAVPSGELISPTADTHRVMADPKLNTNQTSVMLPRWDGSKFKSGTLTIQQEFLRLVNLYGVISTESPAIDKANPAYAPTIDILGKTRGTKPDLGSYEAPEVKLSGNAGVAGVTLTYTDGSPQFALTDGSGNYLLNVSYGWSGTVTPHKIGYAFTPVNKTYSNVQGDQSNQNYTAQVCASCADTDTVGVFRPSNGALYLKNLSITGYADIAINYGLGGDYPVVGDWDGDGDATIGIYRNGVFYLRNANTIGYADIVFAFGSPGDQPVAGDWNGDGIDTIGLYRNGTFCLRNSNSSGAPDTSFNLGNPGDVGIAGDWNGDGVDTTGVFRPSNGIIFLKNTNSTGYADLALNYGLAGDQPITGDWNNDGIDTIGVYRNGQFLLRNSNTIGFAEIVFGLGMPGDIPIAGNWDGLP